jgi:hypothetical protein
MNTISHKRYCILFEKYFKCKSNVSIYNNRDFNIKFIDAIKKVYVELNQTARNECNNEFITKEKISLTAIINELDKEPNSFTYNPILLTSCLSVLTFGIGIMYQSFSTYITKMIDYNIKPTSNNQITINNTNAVLKKVLSIVEDMISSSVLEIMIYLVVALIIIIIAEYIIKSLQASKIVFYKLCYDVLCEIEEGNLK